MASDRSCIAVLGAGSWGTALGMLLARNGHAVRLWDRDARHIDSLLHEHSNERYLPGIALPEGLLPVASLEAALEDCEFVLVAVPSAGFRGVLERIRPLCGDSLRLIWATKGLEPGTGAFLHHIAETVLSGHPARAVLSGPSFAGEVARGLPTAVTIASQDMHYADTAARLFHCERFRAYTSDDLVGVELGGSIKNVLAIAAGISDGLEYGANARAALITRGLAEIMRLGEELGGKRETFMGLSGVGDLVLTCTDDQSRNRRLGLALGQGVGLDQAVQDIGQAVEGLHTARELTELANRLGVEIPIVDHVKQVLFDGMQASFAVQALLSREPKAESG